MLSLSEDSWRGRHHGNLFNNGSSFAGAPEDAAGAGADSTGIFPRMCCSQKPAGVCAPGSRYGYEYEYSRASR
eukprot:scaffold54435_cov29-Prasinocladus_malaysianus.AAC.1